MIRAGGSYRRAASSRSRPRWSGASGWPRRSHPRRPTLGRRRARRGWLTSLVP
jgi:hypothetical protein